MNRIGMALALAAAALLFWSPAVAAQEGATLTVELTIVSGKASVAAEKRAVRKARVEVAVNGGAARVEDRIATPVSVTSSAGEQTQFVPIGFAADLTARPGGGGVALVTLSVDDHAPMAMPVPGVGATGVKAKYAVRGVGVDTTIALPARLDAVVEVAALEDPVTDRAWSMTAKVVNVRGGDRQPSGTPSVNTFFVARIEEGGAKPTTTTSRVAVAPGATGHVEDIVSVPVSVVSAQGAQAQFIPFSTGLNVSATRGSGWTVEVGAARLKTATGGREPAWEHRAATRTLTLTPGAGPSELGALTDGSAAVDFRATIEVTKQE